MTLPALLLVLLLAPAPAAADPLLADALDRAGENRLALEHALATVPEAERPALAWLIARMPDRDLRSLDAEFLLEHSAYAHRALREAPWGAEIPREVFLDAVLPHASVDETRERWRPDLHARFAETVAGAATASEAAVLLNRTIFGELGVKYSTKRPKANQSPGESIEAGLASCTGLSILLIDACRAVGVPARFVGTPLWSDGSGNHSWVEIWDGRWRFTGAAEPTGDALDRGWFTGRAAAADPSDPRHAIYATTWRRTPIHFPMVWARDDHTVAAVDVTSRYTHSETSVPEGHARVRFRVVDPETGDRAARRIELSRDGRVVFTARTRDERFDANDHVEAVLPIGDQLLLSVDGAGGRTIPLTVERDEQLVSVELVTADAVIDVDEDAASGSAEPVGALESWLASDPGRLLTALPDEPWVRAPLDRASADRAARVLIEHRAARLRRTRAEEHAARVVTEGTHRMPYDVRVFGERPEAGHSLWISMHGGGGAPTEVNDRQWQNQKGLYELEEGIYLAPRAPTDTWNLWHRAHIDMLFDRIIENHIALEGIDPDRIYILGYSAGGDGVYQLAPRFGDRLAGAAMMAGHPNETKPDGLRNVAFSLDMGGDDAAYSRNEVARSWQRELARLRAEDPEGYEHRAVIHEGKGHWMDREDAAALPWLAGHTRDPRPDRIVWLQDDVTHTRSSWLAVDTPVARSRVVVERSDGEIRVVESRDVARLQIRLDDRMLDLDAPVRVTHEGAVLHAAVVPRTIAVLATTLAERGDPRSVFCAEIEVEIPSAAPAKGAAEER